MTFKQLLQLHIRQNNFLRFNTGNHLSKCRMTIFWSLLSGPFVCLSGFQLHPEKEQNNENTAILQHAREQEKRERTQSTTSSKQILIGIGKEYSLSKQEQLPEHKETPQHIYIL